MISLFKKKGGFTLIEVGIVVTVLAVLLSISTFNLIGFQNQAYLDTTTEMLISDFKQQQLKSMSGDTDGGSTTVPFGIYLDAGEYVLFTGSTYSSSAPTNFAIQVNESLEITTTFPQSQIVFIKGSGEIQGFTSGNNTITITHVPSGDQKTLTINRYGVIRSAN